MTTKKKTKESKNLENRYVKETNTGTKRKNEKTAPLNKQTQTEISF